MPDQVHKNVPVKPGPQKQEAGSHDKVGTSNKYDNNDKVFYVSTHRTSMTFGTL